LIDDVTTGDEVTEDVINALDSTRPVNESITGNMVVPAKSDEAFCISSKMYDISLATGKC
jgi:hypothetical protein